MVSGTLCLGSTALVRELSLEIVSRHWLSWGKRQRGQVFFPLIPKGWCLNPQPHLAGDIMDSSAEAPPISIKSRTHSVSAGE